jgi:hypothetical protein
MKVIQAATKKGDLHTRDFNKFPLPVLPSEEIPKQIVLNDQEIKNREKRKGRFTESIAVNTKSSLNLEEMSKSVVIVVLFSNIGYM